MKETCVPYAPHPQFSLHNVRPLGLYQFQAMSRTAKAWVETPSKKSSVRQRWDILRNWVAGNGLLSAVPDTHSMSEEEKARVWKIVYEAVERGVSALRRGALGIYRSINVRIRYMEKEGRSPTTISGHSHKLVKLYRYLRFELDEDDVKEVVIKVDSVSVTDSRNLTDPRLGS